MNVPLSMYEHGYHKHYLQNTCLFCTFVLLIYRPKVNKICSNIVTDDLYGHIQTVFIILRIDNQIVEYGY